MRSSCKGKGWMMRIIGKIFLLLFTLSVEACDLSVQILNHAGQATKQVAVGVPFQLHIIASGESELDRLEFSKNMEFCKLNSLGVLKSINNINGVVSRVSVHKYLARIDQPGIYQLGPIQAWQGTSLVGSVDLMVDVSESASLPADLAKEPVLVLKASSLELYCGEQFVLNVKLYAKQGQIVAPKLTIPTGLEELFDLEFKDGQKKSPKERAGVVVDCWHWQILASAKRAGHFMIPAVSVNFEKNDRRNHFFMFSNNAQVTLFSNVLKLMVRDLPPTTEIVQAVGCFSDFIASVDRAELTANQAAQLKLELVGSGNWSKIAITELKNLPANVQAYAGQALLGVNRKQFEFVLQGVQSGTCTIPAQPFYYFDTNFKQYRTIYTKPLVLDVLHASDFPETIDLQKADLTFNIDQSIAPILESGAIKYHQNYYLPISIWLGLCAILILAFLLIWFLKFRPKINQQHKLNLFLLGFLFNVGWLVGNLEEKFLQANQFYLTGEFAKAQQLYESIDFKQAGRGAVVWYNLGNCYFQQKKLISAIQSWLQAGQIGNWQVASNCGANILVAQAQLGLDQSLNFIPSFWFSALILHHNFFSLQLLVLFFLVILLTALIKWPKYAKLWLFLLIVVMSLIINLVILCAKENNLSYAVVQNNSTLLAGPGGQYHGLGPVVAGQIVKIVEQAADWCQIAGGNGLPGGWLSKQDLRIV